MFGDEKKGKLDVEALEKARSEGKKIGLVMGSWDQCHIGHIRYLKRAKEECDYLVVGVDSDAKIRKRKGPNRPLIPEDERYDTIMELGVNKVKTYEPGKSVADDIVFKPVDEEKWSLIKNVEPDVLIAIPENYTMDDIDKLTNEYGVGRVAIFGRQAETSSSNKLRKKLIADFSDKVENYVEKHAQSVGETKERLKETLELGKPYDDMLKHLEDSTDWMCPVSAAAKVEGKWYFASNQCDYTLPKYDLTARTEMFYATVEHAEIGLLKRIGDIGTTDTIYVTLFPCDRCMKTLIDKGIKRIYYLEDHLDRNWSKRSHKLAEEKGIELIKVLKEKVEEKPQEEELQQEVDFSSYKYIYPPNVRKQEQLDIMIDNENNNLDPLDKDVLGNEKVFETEYWNVTKNKFTYEGAEEQFLISSMNPVYNLGSLTNEMIDDLLSVWKRLEKEYNVTGGALCIRFGDCSLSGASLKRLHAHLIKPKEGEKVKFNIGGNKKLKKELRIKNVGE